MNQQKRPARHDALRPHVSDTLRSVDTVGGGEMRTWFDEDSRPVAVDETHPVDFLEPELEPPARSTPDMLTMIERIGGSFTRGNPFIIQAAWRILLNKESKSMRACAKHLGCTPQAISKRVRLLAEKFDYPINDKRLREMRRMVAQRSWAKRRELENPNPTIR